MLLSAFPGLMHDVTEQSCGICKKSLRLYDGFNCDYSNLHSRFTHTIESTLRFPWNWLSPNPVLTCPPDRHLSFKLHPLLGWFKQDPVPASLFSTLLKWTEPELNRSNKPQNGIRFLMLPYRACNLWINIWLVVLSKCSFFKLGSCPGQ